MLTGNSNYNDLNFAMTLQFFNLLNIIIQNLHSVLQYYYYAWYYYYDSNIKHSIQQYCNTECKF